MTTTKSRSLCMRGFSAAFTALILSQGIALTEIRATVITASDGATYDSFGWSVSLSGDSALVGAICDDATDSNQGSAYYYKDLDSNTSGTATQSVKLTASDAAASDYFGASVSLSGDNALVGAYCDDATYTDQGSAYYYKDLDSNDTGTATLSVKLTASDAAAYDYFGYSVSLSGDSALVGALYDDDGGTASGSAYYYKDLDSNDTGTATLSVKLTASDAAAGDYFGASVSLSGDSALVGAYYDDTTYADQGSAYYYKNLDSNDTGTATQSVKLTASDAAADDNFGISVSLSGDSALVGAYGDGGSKGSAYYYTGLSSAGTTAKENVKLTASDAAADDYFGYSVSLSGDSALVGAYCNDASYTNQGAAYYYKDLNSAGTTATQSVKLTASDAAASDKFGYSVSLDGDNFTIGASGANSSTGKAYTGTISSMTTLDVSGGASRTISGVSFVSQMDWIIGSTYSSNTVTQSSGDSATITATGCAVYIGQNAGSNNNTLVINGMLTATNVYVGNTNLNTGNVLEFGSGVSTSGITTIYLAAGNTIMVYGTSYSSDTSSLLSTYFPGTTIKVYDAATTDWTTLTTENYTNLVTLSNDGTYTLLTTAVPEPSTYALFGGLGALGLALYRRRSRKV